MTTIQESFAILVLVALASQAGADVRHPAPGADADVLHQQDTGILEEEEEEEEGEEEEPDCE